MDKLIFAVIYFDFECIALPAFVCIRQFNSFFGDTALFCFPFPIFYGDGLEQCILCAVIKFHFRRNLGSVIFHFHLECLLVLSHRNGNGLFARLFRCKDMTIFHGRGKTSVAAFCPSIQALGTALFCFQGNIQIIQLESFPNSILLGHQAGIQCKGCHGGCISRCIQVYKIIFEFPACIVISGINAFQCKFPGIIAIFKNAVCQFLIIVINGHGFDRAFCFQTITEFISLQLNLLGSIVLHGHQNMCRRFLFHFIKESNSYRDGGLRKFMGEFHQQCAVFHAFCLLGDGIAVLIICNDAVFLQLVERCCFLLAICHMQCQFCLTQIQRHLKFRSQGRFLLKFHPCDLLVFLIQTILFCLCQSVFHGAEMAFCRFRGTADRVKSIAFFLCQCFGKTGQIRQTYGFFQDIFPSCVTGIVCILDGFRTGDYAVFYCHFHHVGTSVRVIASPCGCTVPFAVSDFPFWLCRLCLI